MNGVSTGAQSQARQKAQLISAHDPSFAMHAASQLGLVVHAPAAKSATNGCPTHAAVTRASAVAQSGLI